MIELVIKSIVFTILMYLFFKLMNKTKENEDKENILDDNTVIFDIKKYPKVIASISSLILIILFSYFAISTYIESKSNSIFVVSILFLLIGLIELIEIKKARIEYKNGIFKRKNIFGKIRIYNIKDVTKVKYIDANYFRNVKFYFNNGKKLEINSLQTNFDYILKEIKIRHIDTFY